MNTTNNPHRRLSSRRGSASAYDPFGVHADAETARLASSRITIVRVPPPTHEPPRHGRDERRYSWGSSSAPNSPGAPTRGAPGRLSFAFSSFKAPQAESDSTPSSPGRSSGPPSTPTSPGGFRRSNSGHNLERMFAAGRPPTLTPQQLCDLAASSISSSGAPLDSAAAHTPFLALPDEHYLPFLERPAEVTALVTSPPTSRLFSLLSQTFPPDLRAPYDPLKDAGGEFGKDPTKWSFSELSRWLQTVDRDVADDRTWTAKARACVLGRSELIWSRLKGALGVPPELEEEEFSDDDREYDDEDADVDGEDDGALLEAIHPGDHPVCVASPISAPESAFGFGGRDGGMEIIGEGQEEDAPSGTQPSSTPDDPSSLPIQGLRISTPLVEIAPRPMSPNVPLRRVLSSSAAAQTVTQGVRRASGAVPARRSQQQERGTGDALFPSSFANLGMGPSLVANNPALRAGPPRSHYKNRRLGHRLSGGWDTDGNDYAISLGSGSERSFGGR